MTIKEKRIWLAAFLAAFVFVGLQLGAVAKALRYVGGDIGIERIA